MKRAEARPWLVGVRAALNQRHDLGVRWHSRPVRPPRPGEPRPRMPGSGPAVTENARGEVRRWPGGPRSVAISPARPPEWGKMLCDGEGAWSFAFHPDHDLETKALDDLRVLPHRRVTRAFCNMTRLVLLPGRVGCRRRPSAGRSVRRPMSRVRMEPLVRSQPFVRGTDARHVDSAAPPALCLRQIACRWRMRLQMAEEPSTPV